MKKLLAVITLFVLLSGCGTTEIRTPVDQPYESSSYVVVQSVRVNSEIDILEQGYAVFLRVTSESNASGTGAVVRYPEDGVVIALERNQEYILSPRVQIPNRSDVIVELSVFALPHDTTLEALNILGFALPSLGKAFVAQAPIAPLVGRLLGNAAKKTKEALEEGRMVAYYRANAPDLAAAPSVAANEMRIVATVISGGDGSSEVLAPYQGQATEASDDLPFFMTRLVYVADLEGKSAWELDVMRNEIYARHGRGFDRQDLQAYFDKQPWYTKKYSPNEFDASLLTPLQRQNAVFIREYQIANNLD